MDPQNKSFLVSEVRKIIQSHELLRKKPSFFFLDISYCITLGILRSWSVVLSSQKNRPIASLRLRLSTVNDITQRSMPRVRFTLSPQQHQHWVLAAKAAWGSHSPKNRIDARRRFRWEFIKTQDLTLLEVATLTRIHFCRRMQAMWVLSKHIFTKGC